MQNSSSSIKILLEDPSIENVYFYPDEMPLKKASNVERKK